jgi:DNA gyrase/topoisomerase IV subunit B
VDGMHIRNLMITYFFRFSEQLVHDGHVWRRTVRPASL